jgi:4-methyl-5(b-hydroxyethyl)-thiazole monophosphate biosynthesis
MKQRVLVPIADGTEEMEAITIIDVLRRAGAEVTIASVGDLQVTASRGVTIVADTTIDTCRDAVFDLIALPGGIPGAEHLRDSVILTDLLARQRTQARWYAAICAAPAVVLAHHGLLGPERATCHPSFRDQLPDDSLANLPVVVAGRCVTSQGAGTALAFALQLVELLFDRVTADTVATGMAAAPRERLITPSET